MLVNCRITLSFSNVLCVTIALSFIDNMRFAAVFVFQTERRLYISRQPNDFKDIIVLNEAVQFLKEL